MLPANSARLSAILGRQWLAVGDAAAAHDPLSAHGITAALGAGFYAAQAILGLLDGQADAGLAYLSIMDRTYAHYFQDLHACYADEQRWAGQPFWRRRHRGPATIQGPRGIAGTAALAHYEDARDGPAVARACAVAGSSGARMSAIV